MKNTDKRNRLDDKMFHYRITKNIKRKWCWKIFK